MIVRAVDMCFTILKKFPAIDLRPLHQSQALSRLLAAFQAETLTGAWFVQLLVSIADLLLPILKGSQEGFSAVASMIELIAPLPGNPLNPPLQKGEEKQNKLRPATGQEEPALRLATHFLG